MPAFSRSWLHGLFVVAAIASASALTLLSLHDSKQHSTPAENRPIQSSLSNYVSSNTCRSCHPGNYASWHASFHRTMTQVATTQNLPNDMDKMAFAFNGLEYKAERRENSYFVRMRREGGEFGEARQVVLVTGSHNLQIPWLETHEGRTLEQFPFAYIVAEKMWAPVSETFSESTRSKGNLFHRRVERCVHGLSCYPRRIAFRRGQQMGFAGGGIRHRLRSMSQRRPRTYRSQSRSHSPL